MKMAEKQKRNCLFCKAELSGKQARFCSDKHRNAYWSKKRKEGFAAMDRSDVVAGEDERLQEAWSAFCSFLREYGEDILERIK